MVESEFGAELRRLRLTAGLSIPVFAARIHYSKGYLSRVENGRVRANRRLAEICDEALGADGTLTALVSSDRGGGKGVALKFSGLPSVTRRFADRQAELEEVRAALLDGDTDVCVLTGMAGVGKTALALRAAWSVEGRFPDGCVFFDLRSHSPVLPPMSSVDALDNVLRTLGVPGEEIPADLDGRANLYRHRLRELRLLIVFDNVASVDQLLPLLPGASQCRVLVTSRSRMIAMDEATHVSVEVLPQSEGIRLFRLVCGEALPLDDEPVVRLVERCGSLPLAMRIIAARIRNTQDEGFDDITQRLADESELIDALEDGERSVMTAFRLSYGVLSTDLRQFFGVLALIPGNEIDPRTAAAVAGLSLRPTKRMLAELHDSHMIVRTAGQYYGFHDLLRLFAVDQALTDVSVEDRDDALRRLLDYSTFQAEASSELIAPHRRRLALVLDQLPEVTTGFSDRHQALAWIRHEWPCLVELCKVAADRGMHRRCWQLAFSMRDFFFLDKLWDPWIRTHTIAADAARAANDDRAWGTTLNNLGIAYADRGELSTAAAHYKQAYAVLSQTDDDHGLTNAGCNLGWVDLYLGNHSTALSSLRDAFDSYRRSGSRRNAAITLRGIALTETELGSYDDALAHATQALTEARELDLELDAVMSINCIAWVCYCAGRLAEAASYYAQAVEQGEQCETSYEIARAMTGLGNTHAATGSRQVAEDLWTRASATHSALDPKMVGEARIQLLHRE
ncbi:ATP-binding protein [Nocardia jiangxiensis]|uniref:ATP-binding protein n=1 Tax=Nocardia jiangxiensis TaxID=282685 RepID=UPI000594D1BE|nr:XRE family transcriptional regulator [Nocardia jiangxiensis]